jgi:hypothetical protein
MASENILNHCAFFLILVNSDVLVTLCLLVSSLIVFFPIHLNSSSSSRSTKYFIPNLK